MICKGFSSVRGQIYSTLWLAQDAVVGDAALYKLYKHSAMNTKRRDLIVEISFVFMNVSMKMQKGLLILKVRREPNQALMGVLCQISRKIRIFANKSAVVGDQNIGRWKSLGNIQAFFLRKHGI